MYTLKKTTCLSYYIYTMYIYKTHCILKLINVACFQEFISKMHIF